MYKIAGLNLHIDSEDKLLYKNLEDFAVDNNSEVADITIRIREANTKPASRDKLLYKNTYLSVYEKGNGYIYIYELNSESADETVSTENCELYADINIEENKAELSYLGSNLSFIKEKLFFAIRDIFFLFALKAGRIPIHSSSILYRDKAFLFSASAGVGKTTHTNLWKQLYNVEILDGDVTMLTVKKDGILASGLPWCGTSGKYINKTVPLGSVIFIEKGTTNEVRECNYFEAFVNLCARSFSPNFDKTLVSMSSELAKSICKEKECLYLKCLPDEEAINCIKNYIDKKFF